MSKRSRTTDTRSRQLAFASIAICLLASALEANATRVACTTPSTDPRVTFDDAIDIEMQAGVMRSLHWTSDRIVSDGNGVSHAFECELSVDSSQFAISRTRRGSVAVSTDRTAEDANGRPCRIEVIGTGTRLALVPTCRSGCQTSGRYRSLAIDTDSGLCRPLDDRAQSKGKP